MHAPYFDVEAPICVAGVHLAKSEQNVKFLHQFQERWQAWDIRGGSAKMHFACQAQYKRHMT
jgi:hypothetical protein